MCFVWAELAALFPQKGLPNRVRQYNEHLHAININGFHFLYLATTDVKNLKNSTSSYQSTYQHMTVRQLFTQFT